MAKTSLNQVGEDLAVNGYIFTPIRRKSKAPLFKNWTTNNFEGNWEDWVLVHGECGAGILTAKNPAVDLDIRDEDLVSHMSDYVELVYGSAPTRVGLDPKRLLLFRLSGAKFPTMKSVWYEGDPKTSMKHEVQILGDGQQFIAFGIHPDTNKPYKWVANGDPTSVDYDELPELTEAQAFDIIAEFDRECAKRGWNHTMAVRGQTLGWDDDDEEYEEDDWVNRAADAYSQYDGDYDELERKVMLLPGAEDYQQWIRVIAALQTGVEDQDRAYDIALKWSAQANNFDQDSFDKKWDEGFKHDKKRLISFRSLLQEANEIEDRQRAEAVETLIPKFSGATNRDEWMEAASHFRKVKMFGMARMDVVKVACDKYNELVGRKLSPAEIKKNLSYRIDPDDLPGWLMQWCFNRQTGLFVNIRNGSSSSVQAFDLAMRRYMVDEDPDTTPAKLAMDIYQVPVVDGVMYNPLAHGETPNSEWKPVRECAGRPEFFRFFESDNLAYSTDNGRIFLNTFHPDTMVDMPEDYTQRDLKNIQVMKDFFLVQFPDPKEREYVMEYFAWIVKNPGKRINYALIIHGCPGSGKTIIREMFRCILGDANVGEVSNSDLQSNFTKWAESDIVKFVEEVSVVGHGYDVLNNIKPFITNPVISVRRMREDSLKVRNTASYIMVTNDPAALPIDDNDRRYLVVASQFQDKKRDLMPFLKNEPNFFKRFDRAFRQSAGALRKWFSEFQFRKDFNPSGGHAPMDTMARERMMALSKDDFTDSVITCVSENHTRNVCRDIIFMPSLMEYLEREIDNFKAPNSRSISRKMEAAGFYRVASTHSGKVRMDGKLGRCYSPQPKHFERPDGSPDADEIRAWLDRHNEANVQEDDEFEDDDAL
ncbi:TPA: PriCT-2 domain-containing protein [Enterobacter hormaechei]|nr:PriCT-2 domain-containing protein [Enterobacter hormaechei]